MRKKILLLAVVLAVAACGCGKKLNDNNEATTTSIEIGSVIVLGNYEQDNNIENGKEPIEWIILENNNNQCLVVSKYLLDSKRYHDEDTFVTWENCDLRAWLNESFYQEAFGTEDMKHILVSDITNQDNDEYKIDGGNDTSDKVFLLSSSQAETYVTKKYFSQAEGTEYAKENGLNQNKSLEFSWWWLRSPGCTADQADYVTVYGETNGTGCACMNYGGIRPAMWVSIN